MVVRARTFVVCLTAVACHASPTPPGGGSGSGSAVAPAPRPEPVVPAKLTIRAKDYVVTPNGLFHSSCVVHLNAGEHFEKDGRVLRGTALVRTIAPCKFPHYLRDGTRLFAESLSRPTHDWVAYASRALAPLQTVSAEWTVPAAPSKVAGQVLYYFPGIEPSDGSVIAQPVLQWYAPGVAASSGMPAGWSISSWYCCSSNNTSLGPAIPVQTGDRIAGSIVGSQCDATTGACGTWTVTTTDLKSGSSTPFVANGANADVSQPLTWVVAASLEEWFVDPNACDEYSADDEAFSKLHLATVSGTTPPNTWDQTINAVGHECDFAVAVADVVSISRPKTATVPPVPAPAGHCACGGAWPNDCELCDAPDHGGPP